MCKVTDIFINEYLWINLWLKAHGIVQAGMFLLDG